MINSDTKYNTAKKSTAVRLFCVILLAAAFHNNTHATGAPQELSTPVEPYIDNSTVVVAWTDLAKLDIDETVAFLKTFGNISDDTTQIKPVQEALVKLGVTRIYWTSNLSGIMSGPQAAIVPCNPDNAAAVHLVLKAVVGEQGTATVDGNTVLVGKPKAVADLQTQNRGKPPEELLQTLSTADGDHGIVLMTPVTAVLPVIGVLPRISGEENSEDVEKLAGLLVNLKSLVFSGDLPPAKTTLRATMKSSESASELTELLNTWTTKKLAQAAAPLRATTQQDQIVWTTSSTKEAQAAIGSIMQLTSPARQRANQMTTMNSLKQIGLAMHNFHATYGHFPPQALTNEDGKRLLSWRVLILPFLGEEKLYKEFHLDEPWNSDHNIKLIKRMPFAYQSTSETGEDSDGTKTRMLAPLTKNSVFGRPGSGAKMREITDGTSNSIMTIEAGPGKGIEWTKPDDLMIDSEDPLKSIIDESAKGFPACLCDGSARFFPASIGNDILEALLSINGAEIIDWEKI